MAKSKSKTKRKSTKRRKRRSPTPSLAEQAFAPEPMAGEGQGVGEGDGSKTMIAIILLIFIVAMIGVVYLIANRDQAPKDSVNSTIIDYLPAPVVNVVKKNIGWVVFGLVVLSLLILVFLYRGGKYAYLSKSALLGALNRVRAMDSVEFFDSGEFGDLANSIEENYKYMDNAFKSRFMEISRKILYNEANVAWLEFRKGRQTDKVEIKEIKKEITGIQEQIKSLQAMLISGGNMMERWALKKNENKALVAGTTIENFRPKDSKFNNASEDFYGAK